ncbi:TPA: hypothetical protein DEX28_01000 [Patescibacteria group bacterium]|nr:MAG: Methyltransferase type 12 [Candidatus Woesebacteria bacterium GW2011_GWC1_42_9]HCI05305.1 hypothetical protein [Patescibacteria group bacterium]
MLKRDQKRVLDEIAESYYTEEHGFEATLQKYKILEVSKFCQGESMLDVGCGVGQMTKALAGKFKKVVGIDGSLVKIEKANRENRLSNTEYIHTLFEDFKPEQRFDFIVSANVLEHVDDSVVFMKRLRSWLAPNGRVVVTVPNALGLHKRIGKHIGMIDDYYKLSETDLRKGHKRIYDRELLINDFKESGLEIDYLGGILLKPLSHAQMESWGGKVVDALYEIGHELPDYCSSLIIVGHKD